MPRRNLLWLILIAAVSLVCYFRTTPNRYGRALGDTFSRVSQRYYEPVKDQELFEAAMKGLTSRLDENSGFIGPQQKQAFEETITREFAGVGMEVELDPKTKQIMVKSPMIGAPAYEAGIRAGDRILKIDGRTAEGLSLQDALKLIRGQPGTAVVLTVLHEGQAQPADIAVVRKMIQEDTIRGDTRNPDGSWNFFLPARDRIAYLRITAFAEAEKTDATGKRTKTTVADLQEALQRLTDEGMQGLVLDLRENPGGSLAAAVDICRLFIEPMADDPGPQHEGVVLTTRGRDGQILKTFDTKQAGPFTGFPMAVLVNQHSASASEIVAACLQDYRRAVIVGQRTFGKGTVQEVTDLGDQFGTLKLTIATYWRPSGRNIHRFRDGDGKVPEPNRDRNAEETVDKNADWGVLPDEGCAVPLADEELGRWRRWRDNRDAVAGAKVKASPPGEKEKPFIDRPLTRAVEYLEKEIGSP